MTALFIHGTVSYMNTYTLPATNRPVPDARWAVSSVKMTETSRGVTWVAKLTYDGKPVGSIENQGVGGANDVVMEAEFARLWQEWDDAYSALHPYEPHDPNGILYVDAIESLMEEREELVRLRKLSKKGQVLRLADGRVGTVGFTVRPETISEMYPDCLMWSGSAWNPVS